MHNLEVWNMVLSKERERDRDWRRLEQGRLVQEAIARSTRSEQSRRGILQRTWHVTNSTRHCRWHWARLGRSERERCATAANER